MSRADLDDFDIEIRETYFQIAAEMLDPTPPKLASTDGEPLALTTLTYDLSTTVERAFETLAPMARVHGEDHVDEITHDESGTITGAELSWVRAGNRQHKEWDNTILGTLRLGAERLVVEVNSARRAERAKRAIARRLRGAARLVDTKVIDPSEALVERVRERAAGAGWDGRFRDRLKSTSGCLTGTGSAPTSQAPPDRQVEQRSPADAETGRSDRASPHPAKLATRATNAHEFGIRPGQARRVRRTDR
jgi:hypothetical protein